MNFTNIIIAEDHAILRDGLVSLLSKSPELKIVGQAKDGQEAIHLAKKFKPELILMDLNMPIINGANAIRIILKNNSSIKIIALTGHKSEEYVRATLDAGASGYVLKDETHSVLLNAIESVKNGDTYLSPGICNNVVKTFLKPDYQYDNSEHSWHELTSREQEIFKLISKGNKNREVAEILNISLKTVEKHRSNFMRKLNLHSISAVTKYAIDNNIIN